MKIALLGDIALIGRYDRQITDDVDRRIKSVRMIVQNCDYVIANLESPLTQKKNTVTCKGVYLRSEPVNIVTLKKMGITHVTLANNHIYDYGKKGASDTLRILKRAGIQAVGLGYSSAILQEGKTKVVLEGFCCLSANALNYGNKPGKVNLLTPESLEKFLLKAKKENCFPIASIHYGVEGLHYPSPEHVYLFRKMAEKYDYVLHGNHPHAIQGYEKYDNSLLIYAQGNLCFDETTVTSIHSVPKEKEEERKCYISIIEIVEGKILEHTVHTMTDLKESRISEDEKICEELNIYNTVLERPIEELIANREREVELQRQNAAKRNMRFYLNRLNYKYIGAYLNGKIHARRYNKIIKAYYNDADKG